MTQRLFLSSLACVLVFSTGCMFSKKNRKPKENSAIASEVEESFQRRWIDQRVAQLVAQGVATDAAQAQASREFGERYDFDRPKK
jgi:lipoprotein NlpI